jgi:glyoxylase-like metal-dependent hydrolase (beta-lactamase superfamily II)
MTNGTVFHSLKLGFNWCYLLRCSGGYVLIDTSYPRYAPIFEQKLHGLGIGMSQIKYLLLTHHHDDHAGFAAKLVERTNCRVIAHRRATVPLARGCSEETMRPFNRRVALLFSFFSLFHGEFSFPPLDLADGDLTVEGDDDVALERIGTGGRILSTPGHTTDSISVLLHDGSAFVGDVAMNFLRFTGIGNHPIYIESIEQVYQSWRKLVEAGARIIYPSHGRPFTADSLSRALEAAMT